jgi:hypothetical protein
VEQLLFLEPVPVPTYPDPKHWFQFHPCDLIIVQSPKDKNRLGHFTHLRLPILNLELDGDLESLPVAGGLRDVVADLLGRQAQGTHLHTHVSRRHEESQSSESEFIKHMDPGGKNDPQK